MTATTWTPRSPSLDEPACWSWPLPEVLTLDAELDRLMAEQAARGITEESDPDNWLPRRGFAMSMRDWPRYLMNRWHDGRCALCGARGGHMVDDHSHATGLVRGRLDRGCNIAEGAGATEVVRAYREMYPALILGGLEVWYVGRGWPDGWWQDPTLAYELTRNPRWAIEPDARVLG